MKLHVARTRLVGVELIYLRVGGENSTPAIHKAQREEGIELLHSNARDVKSLCENARLKELSSILDDLHKGAQSYTYLLQQCIMMKALMEGKEVHAHIMKSVLTPNTFLDTTLVNMYVKCGSIEDALWVFHKMPERNVLTWNMIIAGYIRSPHAGETFKLYGQMVGERVKPDEVTFLIMFKVCGSLQSLEQGKWMHDRMIKAGIVANISIESTLIDMYANCGCIEDACRLFDKMSRRDVVAWTAMVSGYSKHGHAKEAVKLLHFMENEGIQPNEVTFVNILSACASPIHLECGKQIHDEMIKTGMKPNTIVNNTLVDMYVKCVSLEDAYQIFHKMPERDVISWTVMIAGYGKYGYVEVAFELFWQMEQSGVRPNEVTYLSILGACANLGQGKHVHVGILKNDLKANLLLENALIDMYAKCGGIDDAYRVFENLSGKDAISWHAMMAGYAKYGFTDEVIRLFQQMEQQGINANEVTFAILLNACASLEQLDRGKQVHAHILTSDIRQNLVMGNSLIDMYAKCGCMHSARQVFDQMSRQDVVSWNSMMTGYVRQGHINEAFNLFSRMEWAGLKWNKITFASILSGCACAVALEQGRQIHAHALKAGFGLDDDLANAFIDMYAKCGTMEDAYTVLSKMPKRDVVSWTALIAGYAQHGQGKEALYLIQQMHKESIKLNHITFVGILSACSHAGLVEEGCFYFDCMSKIDGMTPTAEHYACMVDLFGRAGRLQEAKVLIKEMPFHPCAVVWRSFLSACRVYGNTALGECAARNIFEAEPDDTAAFILLSNSYATACASVD